MDIAPSLAFPSEETGPLIFGFEFTENGIAVPLNWKSVVSKKALPTATRRWLHLNRLDSDAQAWLRGKSGLDPIVCQALLQEETRPRSVRHGDGLLFNFRAVNLNEGAEAENMIALRGWATRDLVITLRAFPIRAVHDLRNAIISGHVPVSTGDLIAEIVRGIVRQIEPVVHDLEEQADAIEENILGGETHLIKSRIAGHRHKVLDLRRYIIPQREALAQTIREGNDIFAEDQALLLREIADQVTRVGEELDAIRDRLVVLQEQVIEERAERMNQRLFVLAILSAIFLPLSFVTGLFGVNIGGMPGVESPMAFAILCLSMLGLTGLLIWILRRMNWL